ncbi:MAG: NAD+ synthase [Sedimentisphaerales bacterium]|nr:NAD+ synthase [Sedimentisphaerales bacterium]
MKIALGQFNAIVGDLHANAEKIRSLYDNALAAAVDVLVFPELALCGYPPEDLLLKAHFVADNRAALEALAAKCPGLTMLVGFPESHLGKTYNAMAVLRDGHIQKIYRKCLLPNYGVFDEHRYFAAGAEPVVITVHDYRIALTICEDVWETQWLANFLEPVDPIDLVINISASPFHVGKIAVRQHILSHCATRLKCGVAYCNLVGGQDELVFDGRSMFVDSAGRVATQAKAFAEDILVAHIVRDGGKIVIKDSVAPVEQLTPVAEVYEALVLGTRDYVQKNKFKKVVIGLSGGIDSALTAAIAVAALGKENVVGVTMPSRFNSNETISDAGLVAKNLGMEFRTIPIGGILETFDTTLHATQGWDNKGLAYENLQARIRGTILMSLSNQCGWLVLTTGNKSETAVGYSTLYGDTAGGFAVIKDVPKTLVYQLADYINKINGREAIPVSTIKRIPTAELRPNQKDSDSLPEYDLLDTILKGYVEEDKSGRELAAQGLPDVIVGKVIRMIDRNEYKRRQSPPGIKITPKAFGKDWRLPITNAYGFYH